MPPFDPHFWRAAGHLEHFLKSRADDHRPIALIGHHFSQMQSLTARLQTAEHHRWDSSAQVVARQLHAQLKCCAVQIATTLATLELRFASSDAPSQAVLYEELLALRNEFEGCVVDLRNRTLSVVTEPIVLEEVELGPFRIVLHWDPVLAHVSPYTVQAIHPCCPEGRSDITHPHVTRDRLCEGDAKQVLRQVLRSGRLTDFFQIIIRVLHTYNSHSPYASLDEWEGIDCQACGAHTAHESSYCNVCESQVCDGCSGYCSYCDTSACETCLSCCARCDQSCCPNCADVCRECGEKVCPRCLNTHQLCQECDDANPIEEVESETVSTAEESPAGLAIQPVGLGQIAVPA